MKLTKEVLLKPGDELEMRIHNRNNFLKIQIWEMEEQNETIKTNQNYEKN